MLVTRNSDEDIQNMAYKMMEFNVECGRFEWVTRNGDPYRFPGSDTPRNQMYNISINDDGGQYREGSKSKSLLSTSCGQRSQSVSPSNERSTSRYSVNRNHNGNKNYKR